MQKGNKFFGPLSSGNGKSEDEKKRAVKLSLIAIVLLIAAIVIFRSCSGTNKLTIETHQTPYICQECGYVAYYTKAESKELIAEAAADGYSGIICSQCDEGFMETAIKCPNCQEVYPVAMTFVEGQLMLPKCPECDMTVVEAETMKK